MILQHRPGLAEAVAPSDHVLLEQRATFCGRQLTLCVTTADAASPDTVVIHVGYGSGQAEVTVRADDEDGSLGAQGPASEAVETLDPAVRATMEHKEIKFCSSGEEGDSEPLAVGILEFDQAINPDTEHDKVTSLTSSKGQQDPAPMAVVASDQADKLSTEHTKKSSSPGQEQQDSGPLAVDTLDQDVSGVKEQAKKSSLSGREQQDSAPLTEGALERTVTPLVERQEKESCFSDQVEDQAPLEVSTLGQDVGPFMKPPKAKNSKADTTARHSELRINRVDLPAVLDDKTLASLLQAKPAVTCLNVDWGLDGRKLDIDIVSEHCRNLVELDLTRFRLDTRSLEQLCIACPELKVVKLPRKCDDSYVEVLLRKLPHLSSLDLAHTNVTGQFLGKSHESMEKLSLAGCSGFGLNHRSAENIPQTACWEKIRELDLSSASVTPADLTEVLKQFPRLEQLSLTHIKSNVFSASLLQPALCEHLRDLDVSHAGSLKASEIVDVLTRCPQLERLSIAGCTVMESSYLNQLYQSRAALRVRELDVSSVRGLATVDLIPILIRSPQLERMLASQLDKIDLAACLTQLSRCTELRELDVSGSKIVQPNPLRIQGTKQAAELQIHPIVLTSLLSGCQKLERLALAGCYILESTSLRQLVHCPKLRDLDLLRVTNVDATDLALGLNGCPLLERLSVVGLRAPLEQLVPPAGLPSLRYLDASQSGLTNNSLRRLPGLFPKLHTLSIQGGTSVSEEGLISYLLRLQQLRSLDLRNTSGVTDALLEKLKESHLSKLRLHCPEGNQLLTAKGLVELALGCTSLKLLGLEGSARTIKDIIDMIKQQLSLHRLLVICVASNVMQDLLVSPRRPAPSLSFIVEFHRRPGPLFIVDAATVNWDRD